MHQNKPGTHCPFLQTGVSPEHSLLLLQPEWELFLETFPKKTKHLEVIKITSCFRTKCHIKPMSRHLPLWWSQCSLGSEHPKSLQPRHLEVIGSQVGWGALHSWLLEQPRNIYFQLKKQENNTLFMCNKHLYSSMWNSNTSYHLFLCREERTKKTRKTKRTNICL